MILAVVVHAASVQDRDGAVAVLTALLGRFPRLRTIFADGGYAGMLVEWAAEVGRWTLRIVRRADKFPKFIVLPKRWIVERTFGWLGRYRRLSKDYEQDTQSSETMILIAMINLMLHRLAPG
jgi:putative transposase